MSARPAPPAGPSRPVVLRQSGAVLVPLAVWVCCVLALVDAVLEGSPSYAVHTTVVVVGLAYAVWVLLFSPRLEVSRDGLRVVNPLRVHDVPYAALETVRVRGLTNLTFHEQGGRTRTVASWNAPGVSRPPRLRGRDRRHPQAAHPVRTAQQELADEARSSEATIERFRSAWERSGAPDRDQLRTATTTWRRRETALLGALLLVAFVTWLL